MKSSRLPISSSQQVPANLIKIITRVADVTLRRNAALRLQRSAPIHADQGRKTSVLMLFHVDAAASTQRNTWQRESFDSSTCCHVRSTPLHFFPSPRVKISTRRVLEKQSTKFLLCWKRKRSPLCRLNLSEINISFASFFFFFSVSQTIPCSRSLFKQRRSALCEEQFEAYWPTCSG